MKVKRLFFLVLGCVCLGLGCIGVVLPRQLYHKDRRKPFWTFTIGFEEAQAFRRANGGYLRKNQWEDLTVDVYI